jgi:hypothetical protein
MSVIRSAILAGMMALLGTPDQAAREYEIKAAFLYNFAAFVEWPRSAFAEAESPIVVCIVGADPFAGALDRTLQGKTAQGRTLTIKRVAAAKDAKGSHIVFLPSGEMERLGDLTGALSGTAALLVGESEGLARKGAVFNFAVEDSRVKLEVNVGAAEKAGLRLGSKLLKIARRVDE